MRGFLALILLAVSGFPALKTEIQSFKKSLKNAIEPVRLFQDKFPISMPLKANWTKSSLSMPRELVFFTRHEARHMKGAPLFNLFYAQKTNENFSNINQIPHISVILNEAEKQKVDACLILAIIQKESRFDSKAHSRYGAVGLMQVLPSTANWLGLKNTKLLWQPSVNTRYGVKYIKVLAKMFKENDLSSIQKDDIKRPGIQKILAAYNAGPGNVKKYGGVPPFKETINYIQMTGLYFSQFKNLHFNGEYSMAWPNSLMLFSNPAIAEIPFS